MFTVIKGGSCNNYDVWQICAVYKLLNCLYFRSFPCSEPLMRELFKTFRYNISNHIIAIKTMLEIDVAWYVFKFFVNHWNWEMLHRIRFKFFPRCSWFKLYPSIQSRVSSIWDLSSTPGINWTFSSHLKPAS